MRALLFFLLGISVYTAYLEFNERFFMNKDIDYGNTGAFALHSRSSCVGNAEPFKDWEAKVEYRSLEGAVGRWTPSTRTIALDPIGGIDVNTIAHEVAHMVDDMMVIYKVQDPHIEAYLQGNWTECVLFLAVEEKNLFIGKITEEELPKFRFAN